MQKKLIALAVAGLISAPVFAQSNVTVYGVLDLTGEWVGADDAGGTNAGIDRFRLQSNSSLIGFKGVEDLGNGLKALFQFETGVNGDTGNFSGAGRDTFVALQSGFGTVILGNLTHPVRAMGSKTDLNPGATGIGFLGSVYGTFGSNKLGTDDRQQLVAYVSPSLFGGLTFTAAYGPGTESPTASSGLQQELNPEMWQVAAQYENGPIYAGLAYHVANDIFNAAGGTSPVALSGTEHEVYRVAGKYTFGFGLTLAGLWDRQSLTGAAIPIDQERDAWAFSVGQSFGAHTLHGGYAEADSVEGLPGDSGVSMWSIGYEYALSKRTMLKAVYAEIDNEGASRADFYTAPIGGIPLGSDPAGFGVGLRHSF
jgi:predicted porin